MNPPEAASPAIGDTGFSPILVGSGLVSNQVYRNRAWRADFGVVPSNLSLTNARFHNWPEDAFGVRISAGYEANGGLGVRFRISSFGQEGTDIHNDPLDFFTGQASLEFYKRLFIESTEVVLGAGIASQDMTFKIGDVQSQFLGGGGTTFAELWHPFLRFQKTDVGLAGRGRVTMAPGTWHDTTGFLIPPTKHDTMTALEIAWGIEVRGRFGKNQDKYWYFMWLLDHQSVGSPWLTQNAATAMTFVGSNLTVGFAL